MNQISALSVRRRGSVVVGVGASNRIRFFPLCGGSSLSRRPPALAERPRAGGLNRSPGQTPVSRQAANVAEARGSESRRGGEGRGGGQLHWLDGRGFVCAFTELLFCCCGL